MRHALAILVTLAPATALAAEDGGVSSSVVLTVIGWAVAAVGIVGAGVLGTIARSARATVREMGAADREAQLTAPRPLDAAAVRERCDAAAKAGPEACVVLVRRLAEETARQECGGCAPTRAELRAATEARIADLRDLLPAMARSATASDAAAGAMREHASVSVDLAADIREQTVALAALREQIVAIARGQS